MSVYVSETTYRVAEATRLSILEEGYDIDWDPKTKEVTITYLGVFIIKKKWREINIVPISDPLMEALKQTWEENHERQSMAKETTGM